MTRAEALAVLGELVAPLSVDALFAEHLGRAVAAVPGTPDHPRARLLGDDPRATVLAAWATHAAAFGFHADGVTGPPPPRGGVDGPDAFAALVAEYQSLGYTLHLPDVAALSPALARAMLAIEAVTRQGTKASLFWSRPGNRAPVHFDNRDNFAIQLHGAKRWFIADGPATPPLPWTDIAAQPRPLGPHRIVETRPGDLLFIPRGLQHTVETLDESLHLSITLMPVTLREAIAAVADHAAAADPAFRVGTLARADDLAGDATRIQAEVVAALERLLAQARAPGFVAAALHQRAARFVADLPRLPPSPAPDSPPAEWPASLVLEHAPGAFAQASATPQLLDWAQPGQRFGLHPGAGGALRFVADHSRFRLGDVPDLAPPVAAALVARLLQTGFLRVAA